MMSTYLPTLLVLELIKDIGTRCLLRLYFTVKYLEQTRCEGIMNGCYIIHVDDDDDDDRARIHTFSSVNSLINLSLHLFMQ